MMLKRTGAFHPTSGALQHGVAGRKRSWVILFTLLTLVLWGASAYADGARLPTSLSPPLKPEPFSLVLETATQLGRIVSLAAEIPAEGECRGRFTHRLGDRPVELCAEYSIEIPAGVEAALFELMLDRSLRNVHLGLNFGQSIQRTGRFLSFEGFGERLEFRSFLGLIERPDLETGILFIAVFNFEERPQQYTLTVELTPVELASGEPHEGSIWDNALGGRIEDPDGLPGFIDYYIEVPPEAGEEGALEIRVENHEAGDIDLFVRFGEPVDVVRVDDEPRILADCFSLEPGGSEFCRLSARSDPPLQPGRYYLLISNHEPTRQRFTLTATVLLEPRIQVSPDHLEFRAQARGPNPGSQTLRIENIGGGTLHWTAESDVPWLALEPREGALAVDEAQEIEVSVDISGLEAGAYQGKITLTSPEAENSPVIVAVTLELLPPPILKVLPEQLVFTASMDRPNPGPQALEIANVGGGILIWSARTDVDWLRIEPTSGVLAADRSQTASVSVDIAGLAAGTHEGHIIVEAPGAENSPFQVTILLELRPPGEIVVLKFVQLEFLRPQDWERRLQEGCVIYKNIAAEPSPIRVTLPDGSTREYEIPAGNEVIVCGDVVHIDTRREPPGG